MAKSDFGSKQELQEYISGLKEIDAQYKSLNRQAKELANVPGKAKVEVYKQLKALKEQYDTHKEILAAIKQAERELSNFKKSQIKVREEVEKTAEAAGKVSEATEEQIKKAGEQQRRLKAVTEDFEEIEGLQRSISTEYGKQYGDIGAIQKKIDATKAIVSGIGHLLQKDSKAYGDQLDNILEIVDLYKDMPVQFARLNKQKNQGLITDKQMQKGLKESFDSFDEMISKIQITNEETAKLVELLILARDEAKDFNKIQTTKQAKKDMAHAFVTESPFGKAPIVGEALSKTSESIFSGKALTGATLVGLGFIIAKATGTLEAVSTAFTKSNQAIANTFKGRERFYDALIKQTDLAVDAQEKLTERLGGYTERFAKFDFETELGQMAIEFDKVSKTAFFGSSIGSVKYAKDQLALAGISATEIVSTMSELSSTSNSAMQSLGEDVAVFSKKTGIGASELGSIINTIRIFDKTGGGQAFDIMQKSLSNSLASGYNLADITKQLAGSAELAAEFNMGSYNAILKQIEATRKLGGDFDKIANAGKSMVLNYKDSIKSEMTLGAILGENVDLSQVRALFAAGRVNEAYAALKASGVASKAQNAGLFAVEALKQATGGLDINQMNAATYETGNKTGLVSNQGYLQSLKSATEAAKVKSANFAIDRAIIKLTQGDLEQGLAYDIGTNQNITRLELFKQGLELSKFIQVELGSLTEGMLHPLNTGKAMLQLGVKGTAHPENMVGANGINVNALAIPSNLKPGATPSGGLLSGGPLGPLIGALNKDTSTVTTNMMKTSNIKLSSIDTNAKRQADAAEAENILQAAMLERLTGQNVIDTLQKGGINLYIDGKKVTDTIIRRTLDSTGVNKSPALNTRK